MLYLKLHCLHCIEDVVRLYEKVTTYKLLCVFRSSDSFYIFSLMVFVSCISLVSCEDDINGNNVEIDSIQRKEICACVPLNTCPTIYSSVDSDDSKYFSTVLKCKKVDHVRCCELEIKGTKEARVVREVIVDAKDSNEILEADSTTEYFDFTTLDITESEESTTSSLDSLDVANSKILSLFELDATKNKREPKKLEDISLIFPNPANLSPDTDKTDQNSLYLIFPGSEDVKEINELPYPTKPLTKPTKTNMQIHNNKSPKRRVVIKKRLLKKKPLKEILVESESNLVTSSPVDPVGIDMAVIKNKLSQMYKKKKRERISFLKLRTATTKNFTEEINNSSNQNSNTMKTKYRSRDHHETLITTTNPRQEFTSRPKMRKVVYDTKTRTNFLKRPEASRSVPSQGLSGDYPEIDVTSTLPTIQEISTEQPIPQVRKSHATFNQETVQQLDFDHRIMIENVQEVLQVN